MASQSNSSAGSAARIASVHLLGGALRSEHMTSSDLREADVPAEGEKETAWAAQAERKAISCGGTRPQRDQVE